MSASKSARSITAAALDSAENGETTPCANGTALREILTRWREPAIDENFAELLADLRERPANAR